MRAAAEASTRSEPAEPARECPVCHAADIEPHLGIDGCPLAHCPQCHLVFAGAEPHDEQLDQLYGKNYFDGSPVGYRDYIGEESAHRRQARRYTRRLQRWHKTQGRLLDVGCAAGFFLDEARREGWQVQGCEVSAFAADHAVTTLGLPVAIGPFLSADLPEGAWDAITLFNVFEHLAQPTAVVAKLHRLLAPGGIVIIETWNTRSWTARLFGASWHQYQPEYVPYYYSPPALQALFREPHWRFLSMRITLKWISLKRGLDILEHKLGSGFRKPAVALSRLAGRLELPYFADDLMMIAIESQSAPGDTAVPHA